LALEHGPQLRVDLVADTVHDFLRQ
jgi:hypothetical protein